MRKMQLVAVCGFLSLAAHILYAFPSGQNHASPLDQALPQETQEFQADAVSAHRFDKGSKLVISDLTPTQIDNLVLLGKVWGFLKYHHPQVTAGKLQWDYELLGILPSIIAAPDHAAAQAALLHWIQGMDGVLPCSHCAKLEDADLQLKPNLAWISNEALLGRDLARMLQFIYQNRVPNQQFYVSLVPKIENPSFGREHSYERVRFPDAGFQLLAAYRFWNIIEYWYPNRNLIEEDWDNVLHNFLPRIALAPSSVEYQREMMALIAQVHDTHANLWSSLPVRPPSGDCWMPLAIRFIDHKAVITHLIPAFTTSPPEFKVGDIITSLDGQPIDKLVQSWSPYYAASNEATQLRDIANSMTNGPCGSVSVGILRGTKNLSIKGNRLPSAQISAGRHTHDLPGESFRMLSDQVAYLKLSNLKSDGVDQYLQQAATAKGLIVDIRYYPSAFVVFSLGSHLVEKPTNFVKFTFADLSNPGAFHWHPGPTLEPETPHYAGKVVILVDELTVSEAEYTAMALRASPNAVVIGSTTAGADGNGSTIPLPGSLHSVISGIGVFYPDSRPTQRIGIVPDKTVVPTIEGIRNQRDEVLEEAIRQILGSGITTEAIEKMTR